MFTVLNKFVYVCFFLFCILQIGLCLNCYECNERDGDFCKYHDIENFTLPCQQESQVCVRHWLPAGVVAEIEYPETIVRGCRDKDYCDIGLTVIEIKANMTMSTRICATCNTDLCNSSNFLTISIPSCLFILLFNFVVIW